MALEEYRRKRDFRKTPEPAGAAPSRKKAAAPLAFVIQEHKARRLHFDFRLELDGVLKSWAVPKGPSLDPGEKRLAVEVEDHPLDYGGFEGVIPEGQYGGGTVLLWDRGTWVPADPNPAAAFAKGTLKFELLGEKLRGNWALVRMGGKAARERRPNWLLVKERDDAAVSQSGDAVVADNPLSVETGRSLEMIARDRDRVWESGKGEATPSRPLDRIPGARWGPMPGNLKPQLATPATAAPAGPEWLHEIKYDGYRLFARIEHGKVRLITRNGLDWTDKFPDLAHAFARLPVDTALIDGELVHLASDGTTNFSGLQDAIASGKTNSLSFFAFDLVYRDGWDLTGASLEDRKAALGEIIPPQAAGILRYSDHQMGQGPAVLRQASNLGLEGIVSKRRESPYRGGRGADWLKVKCRNREEVVVIGFTDPEGKREGFGALLAGYYDPSATLRYAGRVGTGFSAERLADLRKQLDALVVKEPPVVLPKEAPRKGVHWVRPALVAEVEFAGWTADAILRHASFQGLREDKTPREVVYNPDIAPAAEQPTTHMKPGSADPEIATRARDGSTMFEGVRLTHPDRVLYPGDDLTKLDLARYYRAVGGWAVPHLVGRPLTLVRCPGGQGKPCFYQKHLGKGAPDAIGHIDIVEEGETVAYPVIEDLAGLIGLVQMNVIEIHPSGATAEKRDTPDRITFDLDPDEGLAWPRVTEAAIEIREALSAIGLQSFVKTTGGKGLHVVVPLQPRLGWDEVKAFTKWVADRFVAQSPERFTANQAKRARRGRIYIDYLRNSRGATAIGTYSPRARPGAPVSTPLFWEEVEKGVPPDSFSVVTVPQRLAALDADPWAEIGKLRQSIGAAVR
ncbi:MAG TPA: DNA ligase D, partial [Stellaceae bacterium]|nr:DNA ligase D [Stellaceae bacterium]